MWPVLALVLACRPGPAVEPVVPEPRLSAFESCEQLEAFIKDTSLRAARATVEWRRREVLGEVRGQDFAGWNRPSTTDRSTTFRDTSADRADLVQLQGDRLYYLSGARLLVLRSWPPESMELLATVPLEGAPFAVLVDEHHRAVVLHRALSAPAGSAVQVLDLADPLAPRPLLEWRLPGALRTAGLSGHTVQLVLEDRLDDWLSPPAVASDRSDPLESKTLLLSRYDAQLSAWEDGIRQAPLSRWLPPHQRLLDDGSLVDEALDCRRVYRSNAPSRLASATVVRIDLDAPDAPPEQVVVLTELDAMLVTPGRLYLASPHWWTWPREGQEEFSYLYSLDLSGPEVHPLAAGGVPGRVPDALALDEDSAGRVRVAAHAQSLRLLPEFGLAPAALSTQVSVLAEDGGRLALVGQTPAVPGLSDALFLPGLALLGPFSGAEPPLTVDLSDSSAPALGGHLPVPGFATYLAQLDAGPVLSLGTHTAGSVDVRIFAPSSSGPAEQLGSLALADLRTTAASALTARLHPLRWFTQFFHHWPERQLLVAPYIDEMDPATDPEPLRARLWVISLEQSGSPRLLGELVLDDLFNPFRSRISPWAERTVLVGDFLYAVTPAGIRVVDVMDLRAPVRTVYYQPPGFP